MIIKQAPNTAPYTYNNGMAIKAEANTAPIIPTINENDVCKCSLGCEYTEKVFAKVGDAWWKNDKNDFLFQKALSIDTVTIKLYKAGIEVATITDNTYGDYYNGFTAQTKYVGFVIYWENVFNLHGAGFYHVKAEKSIIGIFSTFTSQQFRLLQYTDEEADGTVRIEAYQTGNILRSQFDYTDLLPDGWYSSFRTLGRLYTPDPKKIVNSYINQDYEIKQRRESIQDTWVLETKQLPHLIDEKLVYDNSLANKIQVTDYNIFNHEIFRRKDLYCIEMEKVNEPDQNVERSWKLTFVDATDDIIKTNL